MYMRKMDPGVVWESNDMERLDVTINENLRFDKHLLILEFYVALIVKM